LLVGLFLSFGVNVLFIFFLLILSIGDSQAAEVLSEKNFLEEFPVVLSASRLSQSLSESPSAVTVIDRAMIHASGFRSLVDLFRLVPGMYVGYLNGHTPIAAYHGATDEYSRRMQVLVDGRSVYLPPFSSVDWEDIPLHIADIERIEVVRGPSAASYGANSLEGVINIITRDAGSVHGTNISLVKGNGGVSDITAHLGKAGSELDYRVTFGYRADNGFDTPVLNDNTITRIANLRANYHPLGQDSFDFQLGYNEGVRGAGTAGRPSDPFRNTASHSDFQQLTWLHVKPQGDELKIHYYHIQRHFNDNGGMAAPPEYTDVERNDMELQQTTQIGASNRLVWGIGALSDWVSSTSNLADTQSQHEMRLFAHDEWRASQSVLFNLGGMFEKDGMGHNNFSPRVSINYHLTPQHTLRTSYSVAYRTPAIVEEYASTTPLYFLATGGLRPEKTHSKEIGYLGEFNAMGVTVDARIYADEVSDIILSNPRSTPNWRPFDFGNLLSASYKGFESTVKYHWGEGNSLAFNYSRQMSTCSITGTPINSLFIPLKLQSLVDACPRSVPANSGSALWIRQLGEDIQLSAGYYYQEPLEIMNTSQQSKMSRVDLKVAKLFGRTNKIGGGEIALILQNAFHDNYTGYSAVPQSDNIILFNRRAHVIASFNF
jgi:iron complex outermembrane receptor protein